MTVDVSPALDPARLVVRVDEEDLDIARQLDLYARLSGALDLLPSELVVDLERCRYLDAPALRVLVDTCERAATQGTRLRVEHCSPGVLRLLDLAGQTDTLRATA